MTLDNQTLTETAAAPPSRFSGGIVRAALIISVGNILTRVFGLLRDAVLAGLFATGSFATAFIVADNTLSIFFDLLVSGAISSALVPVLSRYAARAEDRAEFWRVVNVLLTLGLIFLLIVVAILELFADPLARFMTEGKSAEVQNLTVGLTRIILLAVVFLGVSSIMMATLQALQRFVWSALSLAARNAGIVLVSLIFGAWWGVWSLVVGVLFGTFLLIVLQAPGLRDMPLRPSLNFRHPAVKQILRLYAPIFLGLIVTSLALIIDRNLASQSGDDSIGAMRYATNLQQFALGLVGSAISIAILPTLSRQAEDADPAHYRQTLLGGLRLLMVLIIPATIGLLALSIPVITLIYQRGAFGDSSKALTLIALLGYLPGLPAAAIDQMLIFAFYARKNTLTPVLVGVLANLMYLVLAFSVVGWLGMLGLVLANSLQQIFHMTVMFFLLRRLFQQQNRQVVGQRPVVGQRSVAGQNANLLALTLKVLLAALLMGGCAALVAGLITGALGTSSFVPSLLALIAGTTVGSIIYYITLRWLKVDELTFIFSVVRAKLKR